MHYLIYSKHISEGLISINFMNFSLKIKLTRVNEIYLVILNKL
jgi:hypothetical protein